MSLASFSVVASLGSQLEAKPAKGRGFQYDAADGGSKRRTPAIEFRSEDDVLDPTKRAKVQANARDICRNFSIAAWAIRRHLDYVSTFDFHAQTDDDGLNAALENFFYEKSKAYSFDVAGRHDWQSAIRMLEGQAVQQGDNGLMLLADGRIQGIESDRVRESAAVRALKGKWVHGVKVDDAGRALAYAIHKRGGMGTFELERDISAGNMLWHGYYDRWDQVRGVSPIVAGLNPLRDVYENFDYALAKAKVSQLFALAFYRNASEALGPVTEIATDEDGDGEADAESEPRYKVDFGKGPAVLDLEDGDRAEFLESTQPSSQFQDFTQLVCMVALKALDIPYSFFDEAHTNFFGSRGSWLHYERSCRTKRGRLATLQDRLLVRRLKIATLAGEFSPPRGKTITDLEWEFVPAGMPWWKPSEEINGDVQAIGAGLDNPERVCRVRGTGDVYDNLKKTANVIKKAAELGVPLSYAAAPYTIEVAENVGK